MPSQIYSFKTIMKNLIQVCQISAMPHNWGFILWIVVFLTERSVKAMWYFFSLSLYLHYFLFRLQSNSQRAFEPNQVSQRGPKTGKLWESLLAPGRKGSSRSMIEHLPMTRRESLLNQTMQSDRRICSSSAVGSEPDSCLGLCRGQAKYLLCGVALERLPTHGDPATTPQGGDGSAMGTIHLTAQRACPGTTRSEVLWVSQYKWGLPKSKPQAGVIQPPRLESWAQSCWSWGLQYETWKAGNMASNRNHCAVCKHFDTETVLRIG